MKPTVLDTSAVLAMFFAEPGMETMRDLFHKASEADRPVYISAVNWAEVLYKMERKHGQTGLATRTNLNAPRRWKPCRWIANSLKLPRI